MKQNIKNIKDFTNYNILKILDRQKPTDIAKINRCLNAYTQKDKLTVINNIELLHRCKLLSKNNDKCLLNFPLSTNNDISQSYIDKLTITKICTPAIYQATVNKSSIKIISTQKLYLNDEVIALVKGDQGEFICFNSIKSKSMRAIIKFHNYNTDVQPVAVQPLGVPVAVQPVAVQPLGVPVAVQPLGVPVAVPLKKDRYDFYQIKNIQQFTKQKKLCENDIVDIEMASIPDSKARNICNIINLVPQRLKNLEHLAHIIYDYSFDSHKTTCKDDINNKQANIKYLDLTKLPFVTIDPKTAKDHDDAIFVENLDTKEFNSGQILYVAIADVSAFVEENSPIDTEARQRGNTVYLPKSVIPMLPEYLANDLCSLKKDLIRKTIIAKIWINDKGEINKFKFIRAKIKVVNNYAYEEVESFYNQTLKEPKATLKHISQIYPAYITNIFTAYKALKKHNEIRSPLNITSPSFELEFQGERVANIIQKPILTSHTMIEYLMIAANRCAAMAIIQSKFPAIHRIHKKPDEEKIANLINIIRQFGFNKIDEVSTVYFNKILKQAQEKNISLIINNLILRSQQQATYDFLPAGHFGLCLDYYLHFTSPIRRYADLYNHRTIAKHCLDVEFNPITDYKYITQHTNNTLSQKDDNLPSLLSKQERYAMACERHIHASYVASYYEHKINEVFNGQINGLNHSGLYVTIKESGAEGFIPLRTISGGYFYFDVKKQEIATRKRTISFKFGDKISIQLTKVNIFSGQLEFTLINDKKPSSHRTSKKRKNKGKKRDKSQRDKSQRDRSQRDRSQQKLF